MDFDTDIDFWADDSFCSVKKDTTSSGVEETEDKMLRSFKQKTMQVLSKIEELGLPKKGEQIRLVTKRTFNTVAFLKYIADKELITKLNLVVYSINYEAAKVISDLINQRRILKAEILISNLRNKAHREKERLTNELFRDNPHVDLFFCSSHAKIMNFETEKGNYYNVEGSGNLSYNSRIENYIIDNDKEIFDFTNNWFKEIRDFLRGRKEYAEQS
ncbi:MAG TPA: hypothetical protein VLB84_18620 [Bacteroidia bacterium]|nr:hypothetical protein [Bacteroidia bacterium]